MKKSALDRVIDSIEAKVRYYETMLSELRAAQQPAKPRRERKAKGTAHEFGLNEKVAK